MFISLAQINEPKRHPPNPSPSLYGRGVIDYDGDPLRQGLGMVREACALRANHDCLMAAREMGWVFVFFRLAHCVFLLEDGEKGKGMGQ